MEVPRVKEVTVSISFSNKEYGSGTEDFACLKGEYSEGIPLENLLDVVDHGLDLYMASWKTVLAKRFMVGDLRAEPFKQTLEQCTQRLEMVRKYLHQEKNNE